MTFRSFFAATKYHSMKFFFLLNQLVYNNIKDIQGTKVTLCSEGVTKLFPKGFDGQSSIFLDPHGKRKPAPELHLSALNFESSRSIFLHFFQETP